MLEVENSLTGTVATDITINATLSVGKNVKTQFKTATSSFEVQTIRPDENYDYLEGVQINGIPVEYTPNEYGGITVSIGG